MGVPSKTAVTIDDWPGLVLRADPQDTQPGSAQEQVNLQSADMGRIDVRKGLKSVTFDEE